MLAQGGKLILSSRKQEKLAQVKQQLLKDSQRSIPETYVRILPLDLANLDELPSKAISAVKEFGRIDFLINNGANNENIVADQM